MIDESKFTPAQIKLYHMLERGVRIKKDMTGCKYYFLEDPHCKSHRWQGFKTKEHTFNALRDAGLLMLKATEYPFEIYVLKA